MPVESSSERKLAVVTGTSRDVGEFVAYGFAQASWDVLGLYRNPQHDSDQAEIIKKVRGYKVRMSAVREDLLDPSAPDLLLDSVKEIFGSRVDALVLSAATGFGRQIEEAREFNVGANMRLVDKFVESMTPGGVIVYVTSDPSHRYQSYANPEVELGPYNSVAQSKFEAETVLRSRQPEFGERGLRLAVVVGNALEGTFVTRVLKGPRYRAVTENWHEISGGEFPTNMDMASAIVRAARGKYPTGHTEYVGVIPRYQLYPTKPEDTNLA